MGRSPGPRRGKLRGAIRQQKSILPRHRIWREHFPLVPFRGVVEVFVCGEFSRMHVASFPYSVRVVGGFTSGQVVTVRLPPGGSTRYKSRCSFAGTSLEVGHDFGVRVVLKRQLSGSIYITEQPVRPGLVQGARFRNGHLIRTTVRGNAGMAHSSGKVDGRRRRTGDPNSFEQRCFGDSAGVRAIEVECPNPALSVEGELSFVQRQDSVS